MKDIVTDFSQFVSLRANARAGDERALQQAAEQFETLFLQNMLKSMRDASYGDPIFGQSNGDTVYRQMFDEQLASEVASGPGVGLAELLVRQLGGTPVEAAPKSADVTASPAATKATEVNKDGAWASPLEFARRLWPYAKRVATHLGTVPQAVIAQAALETGWGQRMIAHADGRSSHNFFGIKADSSWQGQAVSRPTIEYSDGVARREVAKFRAYESPGAGFKDYMSFLEGNVRYRDVFAHGEDIGAYAAALQQAGYATDPSYASKIKAIANGDAMRDALRGLKFGGLTPID